VLNSRKNIFLVSLLILSMTVFTACNASSPSEKATKEEPDTTNVESETSNEDTSLNEESDNSAVQEEVDEVEAEEPSEGSEEEASEEETTEEDNDTTEKEKEEVNLLLQQLKPEKNMVKTFENKDFSLTETVVDHNETHVQRVFKVGEMVTLQILKWDQDAIQVVYEESNPENVKESILDNFSPDKEAKPLADIKHKGKGDTTRWEIISEDETVEVPYDTYENVVAVRSTVKNGNVNTINTMYYAPGIGMIKEVYEETGDNGYKIESVLKKVEAL
jgi:flagellar biosynthesis GTPase FlhF